MRSLAKFIWLGILFCLLIGLTACQANKAKPLTISPETFPIKPGQVVRVEANHGTIKVLGTKSDQLVISGGIADQTRTQYHTSVQPGSIQVNANSSQAPFFFSQDIPVELEIQAPQGISLTVVTFDGPVSVQDFQGQIKVDSTAGNVEGKNLQGEISLRSGRGDVACSSCAGDVRVVGEHGLLTIDNSHGQIGTTTIMGTIQFTGQLQASDSLHIEVDHGPVKVNLLPGSNVDAAVQSTSGVVVCPPRFGGTSRKCNGKFGEGMGSLYIRTVSGDITLQEQP